MKKLFLKSFAVLALAGFTATAEAVNINLVYTDAAGYGFNDPVLGNQRRAAMEYAAAIWANRLAGTRTITVQANFANLGGTAFAATLGAAGPTAADRDFTGAPLPGTFYVISLARQLNPGTYAAGPDISMTFNNDVDGPVVLGSTTFYYGLDENIGGNIGFVKVALHELGHGLGFIDFVDSADGAWEFGFPSSYDAFLQTNNNAANSPNWASLSNGARFTALTGDSLYWNGPNVNSRLGVTSTLLARMFAPNPFQPGSSISHFRPGFQGFPGIAELMEPSVTGSAINPATSDVVFQDMGYGLLGSTLLPTATLPSGSNPPAATEFNEGASANFTVVLSSTQTVTVTADVNLTNLVRGVDYTTTPASITAGQTNGTVVVNFIDNSVTNPGGRSFDARLSGVVGAVFGSAANVNRPGYVLADPVSTVSGWEVMN